MAPTANTAKTRKSAHDSDSDGYQDRLEEAEAARIRLRKAREDRDKKRNALAAAYRRSLFTTQDRVQKSIAKYQALHTEVHRSRLDRLKKAVDRRDEVLKAIADKLDDLQRLMVGHGTRLRALYDGRRIEVSSVLQGLSPQDKAS
ncbi:hypothetical protein B0T16DRAFT_399997 [Cercophora newfieldiana]|uniref:Uncharacterized protein n=1 Tax=Cercophora newfieldiana TaxID=92897 RepID=A0AA40D149_9PEZI|nr:hypothetical protein B0T16DRAFT_399997 [Cercophora newfieldiana]